MNLEDIEDMFNNTNSIQDLLNPEVYNEETYRNNWTNYCNGINNSINTMWNFILYNQFNNEEIRKLQYQLNKQDNENTHLKRTNKFLRLDLDLHKDINEKLKRKIDDIYDKEDEEKYSCQIFKKRNILKEELNLLEEEEQSIIDREIINNEKKIFELKNIFETLNSISDIIKLKNHKYKFSFLKDEKFIKLYNLIPALEELDSIIGMNEVKETIFRSICYFTRIK